MRLLNVSTLKLQQFFDDKVPPYAILSHTWDEEEVTFQDIENEIDAAKSKLGYRKIEYTCAQAKKEELAWVWVDTCW